MNVKHPKNTQLNRQKFIRNSLLFQQIYWTILQINNNRIKQKLSKNIKEEAIEPIKSWSLHAVCQILLEQNIFHSKLFGQFYFVGCFGCFNLFSLQYNHRLFKILSKNCCSINKPRWNGFFQLLLYVVQVKLQLKKDMIIFFIFSLWTVIITIHLRKKFIFIYNIIISIYILL